MVKWLGGFAGIMAIAALLFFVAVPTAHVSDTYAGNCPKTPLKTGDGYELYVGSDEICSKSGLRVAVEGRLHWLGLY